MEATTWVKNPYVGDIMDTLYTHAAYVHLYAEFESGFSGELYGYDDYAQGENNSKMTVFACFIPGVDEDDYLVGFLSTHMMYFGIRGSDFEDRVTRIIRTSPRALIFGAFRLVVLTRLIPCVVLRTKNHLKIKARGSEIFWLTNICQQQANADDCILILSRRLTN